MTPQLTNSINCESIIVTIVSTLRFIVEKHEPCKQSVYAA